MKPTYLLDTNICIYILADADCDAALEVQSHEVGSVVTSSIVFAEFALGYRRNRGEADRPELDKVVAFFDRVPVLPFDRLAAVRYAKLPFRRGSFDRLIAAHALAVGAVLVTNNPENFADIPDLAVDNWLA